VSFELDNKSIGLSHFVNDWPIDSIDRASPPRLAVSGKLSGKLWCFWHNFVIILTLHLNEISRLTCQHFSRERTLLKALPALTKSLTGECWLTFSGRGYEQLAGEWCQSNWDGNRWMSTNECDETTHNHCTVQSWLRTRSLVWDLWRQLPSDSCSRQDLGCRLSTYVDVAAPMPTATHIHTRYHNKSS